MNAAWCPTILFFHIGPAVKILCPRKGFLQYLCLLDTIHAKCTMVLSQAAVSHQVPVSFPAHNAVWLNFALRDLVVQRMVGHGDSLLLSDCLTDRHEQRDIRLCSVLSGKEEQVRCNGLQTLTSAHR